ncbi:MAG TPA: carboxypeptidase-like regulatory domain-containing protein [Flavisolibacter sp.]|nr:carboxypeptidase-like regulatory domain-containing protein [Flavisolibacter sp.]
MRTLFFLLAVAFGMRAEGQKLLKGLVIDAEKGKPIPYASVFLSNTSVGTQTKEDGSFQINIPAGKYDLIVSSIGYETFSRTVSPVSVEDEISIKLKLKAEAMETVVIEPYEKDGWERWGRFFIENFIGTSLNAAHCTIKNTGVIKFRNSKKTNELTAFASEPLIIENRSLGYTIRYQLEEFKYSFKTHYLIYTGYPFFERMEGNASKQKRWERNRKDAYYGSMMHFMRTLFRNRLEQEGFDVRAVQKIRNDEKLRVKEAAQKNFITKRNANGTASVEVINQDSSDYYHHILSESDYFDVIGKQKLTGDSIAFAVNNTTAGLAFDNYLLITYRKRTAPIEYTKSFPDAGKSMSSQVVLINGRPVEVEANGIYYDPADLMSLGYWAWSEKIALLLPFDYEPPKE